MLADVGCLRRLQPYDQALGKNRHLYVMAAQTIVVSAGRIQEARGQRFVRSKCDLYCRLPFESLESWV